MPYCHDVCSSGKKLSRVSSGLVWWSLISWLCIRPSMHSHPEWGPRYYKASITSQIGLPEDFIPAGSTLNTSSRATEYKGMFVGAYIFELMVAAYSCVRPQVSVASPGICQIEIMKSILLQESIATALPWDGTSDYLHTKHGAGV